MGYAEEIIELSNKIEDITGRNPYQYTTAPGDSVKVVFQNKVCLGRKEGRDYVASLLADIEAGICDGSR